METYKIIFTDGTSCIVNFFPYQTANSAAFDEAVEEACRAQGKTASDIGDMYAL